MYLMYYLDDEGKRVYTLQVREQLSFSAGRPIEGH
jgi:hypothetical protein